MREGGGEVKMMLAIVSLGDVERLTEALLQADYGVTIMAAMGGFLRRQYVTLLIATEDEKVDTAMEVIEANTERHRARLPLFAGPGIREIGAATVFVLNLEAACKY